MELNVEAVEAARLAVEDALVEFRDSGMFILPANNGFVIKNYDGSDSHIIRFGTRTGLEIGIKAYLEALGEK